LPDSPTFEEGPRTVVNKKDTGQLDDRQTREPVGAPAILKHSLAAFEEHGYHGTTVRDIARRVGVTVPTLYYHFENKQAILVELLMSSMELLLAKCRVALAEAGKNPADRYVALITAIVEFMAQRGSHGLLDSEIRSLEPANRTKYIALRDELETQLHRIIDDGIAQRAFTTPYPTETCRAVLTMCHAVPRWFNPAGPLTSHQLAERYVAIALNAVGHRPSSKPRARSKGSATATA
jgi:AcrR family transcriptional regulator